MKPACTGKRRSGAPCPRVARKGEATCARCAKRAAKAAALDALARDPAAPPACGDCGLCDAVLAYEDAAAEQHAIESTASAVSPEANRPVAEGPAEAVDATPAKPKRARKAKAKPAATPAETLAPDYWMCLREYSRPLDEQTAASVAAFHAEQARSFVKPRKGTNVSSYEQFIAAKSATARFDGIEVAPGDLHAALKPHQRDLTRWALRKGRCAVFADTGLGKSFSELEWARVVSQRGRVIIAAPLGVAQQTVREGERWGIPCSYLREDDESARIVVTNYEMLHAFDPARFVGVALDESSILKNHTGATRNALIAAFAETPYRTCWTATPAPNDHTELGNHSEFLGIKTRAEMLAEFFVHDGGSTQDWRVKGHAVTAFWRWVASWGAVVRLPSDLGHADEGYRLPSLRMHTHIIETDDGPVPAAKAGATGLLFADDAATLSEQRALRRLTLGQRVAAAIEIVDRAPKEPALIWCELNDEQDALEEAFGDRAWSIRGSDTLDQKEQRIAAWLEGRRAVMIGKPSMLGMGLNFQHCARQIFVGASHSYEQTYQAIRRCWRFGQTRPVDVHVISADKERLVVENYRRKESDAARMAAEMAAQVGESVRAEVCGASAKEWTAYDASAAMNVPDWIGAEEAA